MAINRQIYQEIDCRLIVKLIPKFHLKCGSNMDNAKSYDMFVVAIISYIPCQVVTSRKMCTKYFLVK